jgi:prepilin peptidase CpaA
MIIISLIFLTLVGLAAISDLRKRTISNRLNLTILLSGLAWRATSLEVSTLLWGVGGFAVGLSLLIIPFAFRWVGAGDVKLLAACGAWLGPTNIAIVGLFGVAGGGILALAFALYGGYARSVAKNVQMSIMTMSSPHVPDRGKKNQVPLGVPYAVSAAVFFLLWGV